MLNNFNNFDSGYLSKEMYFLDGDSKKIDEKILNDFVLSFEVESNFFRPFLIGTLICHQNFFKLSIGKEVETIAQNVFIRFIFVDKNQKTFDRVFMILKSSTLKDNNEKANDFIKVSLVDIHGYYLQETSSLSKTNTYKGKPLEIVENILKDVFEEPNELLEAYACKHLKLDIDSKRNELEFIKNDNEEISYKIQNNLNPLENLNKICLQNNIFIFQDFYSFFAIQNPNFSELTKIKSKDETPLWCEDIQNGYPYKICDKIKQPTTVNLLDRPNIEISLNKGGKEQIKQKLDYDLFIKSLQLNDNVDEYKTLLKEKSFTESSGTNGLSSIVYEYTKKYLTSNNLIIYSTPIIEKCSVGTVTSTKISSNTQFKGEQIEGDFKYSGNWLIRSSTFKLVDRFLINRLVLCRFDNQKDVLEIKKENVIVDEKQRETFPTSKPELPLTSPIAKQPTKNQKDLTKEIQNISNINKKISNLKTLKEKKDFLNNLKNIDFKSLNLNGINDDFINKVKNLSLNDLENGLDFLKELNKDKFSDYLEKLKNNFKEMNNQITQYIDNAKREIENKVNLIKSKMNNQVSLNEIVKNSYEILNKNIKSIEYIDNLINQSSSFNLNEIKNLDSILKESSLRMIENFKGDVERQYNTLKGNVEESVKAIIKGSQEVSKIPEKTENFDSAIENVKNVLESAKEIKEKIEKTKESFENSKEMFKQKKEEIEKIVDTVKQTDILQELKNKRNEILNKLR